MRHSETRMPIGDFAGARPSQNRGGRALRQVKGQLNASEAGYRDHLTLLVRAGLIREFETMPPPIILCRTCKLHVDFRVVRLDGSIEYHDVKGTTRTPKRKIPVPRVEDDAGVKMKWAQCVCPNARFYYVYPVNGEWERKAVRV